MKKRVLFLIILSFAFFSCSDNDPRAYVIKILKLAQKGEKEKIMNMISSEHWEGDELVDGTKMGKEETVEELIEAVKGRKIKTKDDVQIYIDDPYGIMLIYEDENYVNGEKLILDVYLLKSKEGFSIMSIVVL